MSQTLAANPLNCYSCRRGGDRGANQLQFRLPAMGLAISLALWSSAFGMKLDHNVDAINAAIDPSKSPEIADPIFPPSHSFSELGPPGPYTPERATRLGLGGVAIMQCALALTGKLDKCTLLADSPLGFSFGDAALKMAGDGYLKAKPPQVFSAGDQVRVIVIFPKPSGSFR
jgi:hypothetical protein